MPLSFPSYEQPSMSRAPYMLLLYHLSRNVKSLLFIKTNTHMVLTFFETARKLLTTFCCCLFLVRLPLTASPRTPASVSGPSWAKLYDRDDRPFW